jgi:hypothetical protein
MARMVMQKFKVISDIFNVNRVCTNRVANLSNTPPNRLEGAKALRDELQAYTPYTHWIRSWMGTNLVSTR